MIKELIYLIEKSKQIKDEIETTFANAYLNLQKANVTLGVCEDIANSISIEDSLKISSRSIMGVDIPSVTIEDNGVDLSYGLYITNSQFDNAFISFYKVKILVVKMAEIESSIYKIAIAIKKTQSRANALSNIIIPNFTESIKYITEALEEKEREEFSRMKVLKNRKAKADKRKV